MANVNNASIDFDKSLDLKEFPFFGSDLKFFENYKNKFFISIPNGTLIVDYDNNFNEPNNRWTGAEVWLNTSGNGHDGEGWSGTVASTNQASHTITVDQRMPPLPANGFNLLKND